jgi:DNA mismatch endonuclease (patch repair protein)
MGYRYRLHDAKLPGKPDLVFPKSQKVIFVHGCFWHRHRCRLGRPLPATNPEFWQEKFERNKKWDRKVVAKLKRAGWCVLVVWECQARAPHLLRDRIRTFLEAGNPVTRLSPALGP